MPVCQTGSSPPGRGHSRGHLCLAFHFGRIMGVRRGDHKVKHKIARSAAAHATSSPQVGDGLAVKSLHSTGYSLVQPDASEQQGGAGWPDKKTARQRLPWAVLAGGDGASKPAAAAGRTPRLYKPSSGLMVIWKCMRLSFPSGNTMLVPLVRLSSEMSAGNNAHA